MSKCVLWFKHKIRYDEKRHGYYCIHCGKTNLKVLTELNCISKGGKK